MSLSWSEFWLLLSIILAILTSLKCDDDFEGLFSLPVEHSFGVGSEELFTKRGVITINSMTNNHAHFMQEAPLSDEEKEKLKKLAENDGVYRIRIPTKYVGNEPVQYASTFVKACSLYESELSDEIGVTVDLTGVVLGVSLTTSPAVCVGKKIDYSDINDFNTTIDIRQAVPAPVPDTQTYVQKMEHEKSEKAKGQQADNRSFFAKYWMYIVPGVIILMLMSSADQAGGGGR